MEDPSSAHAAASSSTDLAPERFPVEREPPSKRDDVLIALTAKHLKIILISLGVAVLAVVSGLALMQTDPYPRPRIRLQLAKALTVTGRVKILTLDEIRGVRETYKGNTLTLDDIRGNAIMDLRADERRRLICALHYNEPISLCVLRLETPLNGREFLIMHNLNITSWMPLKRFNDEGSPFCPLPDTMYKVQRFVGVTASYFDSDGLLWQFPVIDREAFGVQHAVQLNALEHPCTANTLEAFRIKLENARYYKEAYSISEAK